MNQIYRIEPLLNAKELAFVMKKNVSYVYAAKSKGFIMPGGVATLTEFRSWLARNHPPKSKKWSCG